MNRLLASATNSLSITARRSDRATRSSHVWPRVRGPLCTCLPALPVALIAANSCSSTGAVSPSSRRRRALSLLRHALPYNRDNHLSPGFLNIGLNRPFGSSQSYVLYGQGAPV
mgnify:CR=1 FL=1